LVYILLNFLKLVLFCFILYYYEVIGDHKTSKSLISNALLPGKGLSSNAQRLGRALQENAPGGMGTLGFD
jgi:hypothetical protein